MAHALVKHGRYHTTRCRGVKDVPTFVACLRASWARRPSRKCPVDHALVMRRLVDRRHRENPLRSPGEVGRHTAGRNVCSPEFCFLQDVQVIEDVLNGAIVRKALKESPDGRFRPALHRLGHCSQPPAKSDTRRPISPDQAGDTANRSLVVLQARFSQSTWY